VGDRASERTGQIVVTPGHLEHLTVSFTRTWQRSPTAQELAGLIEDYIREEVLYREAVAAYTVGTLGAYWTLQRTVLLLGGWR
jgi:hypothetical protein